MCLPTRKLAQSSVNGGLRWRHIRLTLALATCSWVLYIFYLMLTTHPCLHSSKCIAALVMGTNVSSFNSTQVIILPTKPTGMGNIVFGIASSAAKWPIRKHYVELWWKPQIMRGYVWLDKEIQDENKDDRRFPKLRVSEDTSKYKYTFKKGLRSAIRISRIVLETYRMGLDDVHWFVMGDDDTVFFPENLVQVLSKYDHNEFYYIGGSSESVEQNVAHSFGMAFGGGGFAISYPLAKALDKVMDACLDRYSHLYGSDERVHACLTDLGVPLTKEPGFHQVDFRGDILGWLSAHPQTPLVSLHHLDAMAPIFPKLNQTEAFNHIFEAVKADSSRILQQAICYDMTQMTTLSISWGYSIFAFSEIQLPLELEKAHHTFIQWRKSLTDKFMFNTRDGFRNPCQRPSVFFFKNVTVGPDFINTTYTKETNPGCLSRKDTMESLQQILVLSPSSQLNWTKSPRRHCCDILSSSRSMYIIQIRRCINEESIYP